MRMFVSKTASFTWNSKGECFGVVMVKDGQRYKVLKHWYEKKSSMDNISRAIRKGYSALEIGENDIVLGGEMGMKCSFADFEQPSINSKDMKNSLGFSLSSHFPVDPVELKWCYRVIGKTAGELLHIRLLALKKRVWNDWLDHVGVIKIDRIIPPAAVCDAVIKDPVYIPLDEEKGFILSHNEDGKLCSKASSEDFVDDGVFGAGDFPLDHQLVDATDLESLDPELQQKFAQPILLALYGLSPCLKRDKETGFDTPAGLIPRRNVALKTACGALAIFLLMLGIFQASRIMAYKKKEGAVIDAKINQLKKEAQVNMVDNATFKKLVELHNEMTVKVAKTVSVKDILVVLTETLPDDFYLSSLSVKGNDVKCKVVQLNTERDRDDLYGIFKKGSFFEQNILITQRTRDFELSLQVASPLTSAKEENN